MKQIVFSLTSNGHDYYSAMTRVSVASLRQSNPDARLVLICDEESLAALQHCNDALLRAVDECHALTTQPGGAEFRNRFVKTSLRSILNGPFLFLDSDIFVRGSLDAVFSLDCDLAGARNHSREIFSEQVWDRDRATLDAMDWSIGSEVYLNGGVLYFNDTPSARKFATEWHGRWLESSARCDTCRDQPALNSALAACRPRLTLLPDGFNAQIVPSPEAAVDALVWHFYASAARPASTGFDELVGNLLSGGTLSPGDIRRYALSRHPWNDAGMIEVGLQLAALRDESTQLKRALEGAQREIEGLRCDQAQLRKVLASRSWRLSRPLRTIHAMLKKY